MTCKEILELFVPHVFTLLGIMIWPLALVVFAFIFRAPISGLIDRISEGEVWGTKWKAPKQDREEAKNASKIEPKLTGGGQSMRNGPLVPASATPPNPLPPIVSGAGQPFYDSIENAIRNDPRIQGMDDAAKLRVLISAQAVIQSHVVFERVYRLIFGSQLYALDLSDRPGGIPLSDVETIFNSAKAKFPDFHKDRTFGQWCQFMIDAGLAAELPSQNGVKMAGATPLGHYFVLYVKEQRYPEPYG